MSGRGMVGMRKIRGDKKGEHGGGTEKKKMEVLI